MATVGDRAAGVETARGVGAGRGLEIPRVYSTEGISPFDQVEWERRSAAIKDERGRVLFEQTECEIPASWSQLATNVVVSKYFYGEVGTPEREGSVRQLVDRVTSTIADWGRADGYFATEADADRFHDELTAMCLQQVGSFNSPVWFNVGLFHRYGIEGPANNWRWDEETRSIVRAESAYKHPQGSACFIQSVSDDMESIMRLAHAEAMLFKFGSGTGTDLSSLRSAKEKLSGGGKPSGPVSFMRVYGRGRLVVKSGGKTRRAAKMQTLKIWHPDILEFIECKTKEEKKAQALIRQGYEANFNGEAYSSVLFQNANLSVRVTDGFLRAAESDGEWTTRAVTTGRPMNTYRAALLMDRIAEGTWLCGDPGMQYEDTIQRWHTCPNSAPINSSNPCSEYMFLDDSACNLSSLNLMKFRREDGSFDVERFRHAVKVYITAQEILVDRCSYPTEKIALNSHRFRPLGLGFANLGSLLMASGLPYDSDEGRALAGAITAIMHGQANLTSAEIAAHVGPFEGFALNREPMLRVMEMHRDAVGSIGASCPDALRTAGARGLGRRPRRRPPARLPQRPGHGHRAHGHDRLHDGLRHHGHRARHRAGEVQEPGRRRHAQDRQPHGADGPAHPRLRRPDDPGRARPHRRARHDRGRPGPEGRAPAGVRLCLPARAGRPVDRLDGPRRHDGRGAAVPLGRDLQDGEHAPRVDRRRHPRGVPGRLAPGPQGAGHLPRRLEGEPAGEHLERGVEGERGAGEGRRRERAARPGCRVGRPARAGRRGGRARTGARPRPRGARPRASPAPPRAPARDAPERDPQVRHPGARGVSDRRLLRRRPPRRAVRDDGQGGLDHRRPDGHDRHARLDGLAVRRAARGLRQQVRPQPLRAVGLHQEPRHPDRQEHHRLPLPLDGHPVRPRLPRGEHPPARRRRLRPGARPRRPRGRRARAARGPDDQDERPPQGHRGRHGARRGRARPRAFARPGRAGVSRRPGAPPGGGLVTLEAQQSQFAHFQSDAPACDNCGALTVRCGTCYRCFNCGNSMGCS